MGENESNSREKSVAIHGTYEDNSVSKAQNLGVTEPSKERGGEDRADGHDEEGEGNLGDGQVQAGGQEGGQGGLEKKTLKKG